MEFTATTINEKELDPKMRNLWLKALSAFELRNYKYTLSLLQNVLSNEPAFLEGRKMLREAEIQLNKDKKKSLFNIGGLSTMKLQGMLKKDPLAAIVEVEKVLAKDPFDVSANQLLHDAATRQGMTETAAFALETIRRGHPENTRNLHRLAEHYMENDDPEKAGDVYEEIKRRDPTDGDAIKGSKDASARASMKKGKWEDKSAGIDHLKKDAGEADDLENADRAAMTREQMNDKLVQLGELYDKDPNNLSVVKQIATLYEKMEDFESAVTYYEWAHSLSKGDAALELRVAVLKEKVVDLKLRDQENYIKDNPDADDIEERVAAFEKLKKEHNMELVGASKKRVDKNPTDKTLRFELGKHLYHAGNYTDAIPQLQQAKSNPHLRTKAMLLLGMCFESKKMYDLAEAQLKEAASELTAMDNTKKEIVYELGLVYEKMGQQTESLDCMKQIYNSDYDYRDVKDRVESSYA